MDDEEIRVGCEVQCFCSLSAYVTRRREGVKGTFDIRIELFLVE